MRYRKLGGTRFEVSEIGYGAWGIGGIQWLGGTDEEARAALNAAIDRGLNFIDTALAYGEGHSEQLAGPAVRHAGQRIYVATKVPPKNHTWPARPGTPIDEVFPYGHIVQSTEQSLQNLGVGTIDLQQLHVWTPEWIGCEEWRRAAEDLKRSGKIRAFGISLNSHAPDTALEVIETGLIDCVQVVYNIFEQAPEQNLFPLAIQRNIGVIARVPLEEGALTGTIDENTRFDPQDFRAEYFSGERKKQMIERVAALKRDLEAAGVSEPLPEVALRFSISHPAVSTVIPGMRRVRHALSNCGVSDRGPLDANTLALLRRHAWLRSPY